jgi:flagellar basal body-associated protein FliL
LTINDIYAKVEKGVLNLTGKSLNTILLAIIAVLTLALAVMSVFLFTAGNDKKTTVEETEKKTTERVVPPEEQAEFNLYAGDSEEANAGDAVFNIKSTEDHPNSFLMASVSIIYDGGSKNELLETRKSLLKSTYLSDLKQATIEYFRGKTFEELQATDAMQIARDNLKEIYSKIISQDPEEKIILRIVFDKWIIQ